MDGDENSPEGSVDGNNTPKSTDSTERTTKTLKASLHPPRNKLLLKPFLPDLAPLTSPPTTPRSPLPPSPLRRTPSPSESSTKNASSEHHRDSYDSGTSSSPSSSVVDSPLEDSPPAPPPTVPPINAPPTPPTPPEKLRLLKALEIRRQKLSGKPVAVIPKIEAPAQPDTRSSDNMNGASPPKSIANKSPVVKHASLNNRNHIIEAKKAAMEEHRRHISALESSGRDLLCGWVNFQSSTSLVHTTSPF